MCAFLFQHKKIMILTNICSMLIYFSGPDLRRKETLLSAAVLIGLLKQRNSTNANFVNAPTLAKDNGYEVSDVNVCPSPKGDKTAIILLTVKSSNASHSIVVEFKGDQPMLYVLDNCNFNSPPCLANNLIICRGEHSTNGVRELLGTLMEKGINSISWSAAYNGNTWYAISCSSKCDTLPNNLSKIIDVWAQLNL